MDLKWEKEVGGLSLQEQWRKLYQRKIKANYPGLWGKGKSTTKYNILKQELPKVFKAYNIKTLVDCGCGNFFWLNSINWGNTKYLGLDIVPELIEANKKKYPAFDFKCLDITKEVPPQADMLFVRSVFFHLTNDEIVQAVKNIKASGSTYLMATTTFNISENKDTSCLMLIKRNLRLPPFNFPEPVEIVMEHEPTNDKEIFSAMGIWGIENL
jgi:hypothetical protein